MRASKSLRETKERNNNLVAEMETLKSFQDSNRSIGVGTVQSMKDGFEQQIKRLESRLRLIGTESESRAGRRGEQT